MVFFKLPRTSHDTKTVQNVAIICKLSSLITHSLVATNARPNAKSFTGSLFLPPCDCSINSLMSKLLIVQSRVRAPGRSRGIRTEGRSSAWHGWKDGWMYGWMEYGWVDSGMVNIPSYLPSLEPCWAGSWTSPTWMLIVSTSTGSSKK